MTGQILITISLVAILFCNYMLFRNMKVSRLKKELLDRVHDKAKEDVENNRDWEWRFKALDQQGATYSEMMVRFWKLVKINSFYKNTNFLS